MDRSWFALAARLLGLSAAAFVMAIVALVMGTPTLDGLPPATLGLVAMTGVLLAGCIAMLVIAREPPAAAPAASPAQTMPAPK